MIVDPSLLHTSELKTYYHARIIAGEDSCNLLSFSHGWDVLTIHSHLCGLNLWDRSRLYTRMYSSLLESSTDLMISGVGYKMVHEFTAWCTWVNMWDGVRWSNRFFLGGDIPQFLFGWVVEPMQQPNRTKTVVQLRVLESESDPCEENLDPKVFSAGNSSRVFWQSTASCCSYTLMTHWLSVMATTTSINRLLSPIFWLCFCEERIWDWDYPSLPGFPSHLLPPPLPLSFCSLPCLSPSPLLFIYIYLYSQSSLPTPSLLSYLLHLTPSPLTSSSFPINLSLPSPCFLTAPPFLFLLFPPLLWLSSFLVHFPSITSLHFPLVPLLSFNLTLLLSFASSSLPFLSFASSTPTPLLWLSFLLPGSLLSPLLFSFFVRREPGTKITPFSSSLLPSHLLPHSIPPLPVSLPLSPLPHSLPSDPLPHSPLSFTPSLPSYPLHLTPSPFISYPFPINISCSLLMLPHSPSLLAFHFSPPLLWLPSFLIHFCTHI